MKETSRMVFDYVKANDGADFTAADIYEALKDKGITSKQQVNGIITSAFQRKGLMERVEAEIEYTNDEGKARHETVKFIKLTEAGKAFDPDAVEEKPAK